MNEELKPCPFCSGTTEDQWHPRAAMFAGGPLKDSILHSIRCRGCGASTQIYDTLENAIVAWNTRPAEKAELDEKELAEFIADEADRIHPSFDLLARAICRHFQPVEKSELDEEKLAETILNVQEVLEKSGQDIRLLQSHRREIAKAICGRFRPAGTNKLVEALHHIIEYWNQDENENAMADALWHIIDTARQALADFEKQTQK